STAAEAALKASDEGISTFEAAIARDKADLDRMKSELDRAESLYKEQLMAKQDFDLKKFGYAAQVAAVKESETRISQAKAQREQTPASLASARRGGAPARGQPPPRPDPPAAPP